MKTNDITIASFPKSGVSYFGYLLTTVRAIANGLPIRPNFFNIDWLLIDEGQMKGRDHADLWRDGAGNFIKTHADGRGDKNVIYLLRNPVPTLKSYYYFMQHGYGYKGNPQQFLEDPKHGTAAWLRHLDSWIRSSKSPSQSVMVVQYEDLVIDPAGTLNHVFYGLGLMQIDEESIDQAVEWSGLRNMRQLEDSFAKRNPAYQQFNLEFVRKGDQREVTGWTAQHDAFIESRCGDAYREVVAKLPPRASRPDVNPFD